MAEHDRRHGLRAAAERTLRGLEPMAERVVQAALDEVAEGYAAHLSASGWELVAQGEPVDEADAQAVAELWWAQIPFVLAPLVGVYGAGAGAMLRWLTVTSRGDQEPEGDHPETPSEPDRDDEDARADPVRRSADLVDAYLRDPETLPERVQRYLRTAENRMRDVGDDLWKAARETLAQGVAAGDDMDQLRDRLKETFAEHGNQLGDVRARRIARTEVLSAWHTAAYDEAWDLPEEDRPTVKEWISTLDTRTRSTHWVADGARVLLDEPFIVGGAPLMFPGDPLGPPGEIIQCRCSMVLDWDEDTVPRGADRDQGRQFLTEDEVAEVVSYFEEKGIVREIDQQEVTAAAGSPHSGAMVALVPSPQDVERLAVEGGLPPEELHLTLLFLGPAEDIPEDARVAIVDRLRSHVEEAQAAGVGAVEANGFAISAFNPNGDDPCIVLGVGGGDLPAIHDAVAGMVWEAYEMPPQHEPWVPHVTLTYTDDLSQVAALADRTGPIVFDRLRIAYAGDITDIPLSPPQEESAVTADATDLTTPRRWHTPGSDALAFENQQTGDGRVFAPGALYWQDGPWPLQYADEMLSGHEGAELAGAIETLERDGDRIPGTGVLYPSQHAGANAIRLLEEGAPLGVSVDLDDVDVEFVDARPPEERDQTDDGAEVVLLASLAHATVTPLDEGGYAVRATHREEHTASGATVRADHTVQWTTTPNGRVAAPALRAALSAAGIVTAAAGDADDTSGEVLMAERAGDFLMRITRGRLRGATLVSMPAFAGARITLETVEVTADGAPERGRMREVIAYVATSPVPVSATDVATALEMSTAQARDYLARAAAAGHLVRLARGLYVGASTLPEDRPEVVAAMSGDLDLPIHDERDAEWDGSAAASRVLEWATRDDGTVNADRLAAAFLWRDPDKDPATLAAYKLGIADVYERDGGQRLEIVARGVFAVAGVLSGGRGGVDIPEDEQDAIRDRVSALYRRLSEAFDEHLVAPWEPEEMDELEASAWTEMQALPPMPAAWFREPTAEELPPGSGGVHYADGRIYGWVAQAGVPHEAFPGRNLTIESLGDIDTTAFLRARFQLDDGSTVRVGAFTMNVGHHRDGAECETAACQWDDTRTVAGIVTVGMNSGGMWFSGAAAPWISDWDKATFLACQPSYHMRQERNGRWSLRAVLSVPVPGHPSRLAAAAVISRANMALAASARPVPQPAPAVDYETLAAAVVDEMERREAVRAEIDRMAADLAPARAELAATLAAQIKGGN